MVETMFLLKLPILEWKNQELASNQKGRQEETSIIILSSDLIQDLQGFGETN